MEDKKYVWWSEGRQFYNDQIFDTEEDAVKAAREEYLQAALSLDTEYFDESVDDEEKLHPIVQIGLVENLDVKSMVNRIFINAVDTANDFVTDFGFHCDNEPEFDTKAEDDLELKAAIEKWVKSAHIMPTALAIPMYEYDCENDKIIKE